MGEYADEVVERMVAHLRKVVATYGPEKVTDVHGFLAEARAIVALLPVPVDPDIDEVKALFAAAFPEGHGSTGSDGVARSRAIASGSSRFGGSTMDYWEAKVAMAALKRGRQLAEQSK